MSGRCCGTAARQVGRSASWATPAAVLLLVPKCPVCLAAYAAATGISMSVSTAGWLRTALIGGSIVALLGLSARVLRRWWQRKAYPRAGRFGI